MVTVQGLSRSWTVDGRGVSHWARYRSKSAKVLILQPARCIVPAVAQQTRNDLLVKEGFLAKGSRVAIRCVASSDTEEYIRLSAASTELHGPWIYSPRSEEEFEKFLERFDGLNALCLLVCTISPETIVGSVSVSGIVRDPYRRGILGYGVFAGSAGQGYMTEGLRLVINYCFSELKLHRLEADIQPENERSIALAARAGMRREGFSPKFIFINGVWRDHERWAIINEPHGT